MKDEEFSCKEGQTITNEERAASREDSSSPHETAIPHSSLKEKTARGLFWGGISNGVQQLLNLLFGIFLARLLTPDDYGMVAVLSIFSLVASSLQESGSQFFAGKWIYGRFGQQKGCRTPRLQRRVLV